MRTVDRPQSGQSFGRYQIVRLIGEGGMGAVYEALHPVLKKRFAIKTLLPSIAQTPEVRTRFLREGEAASRIDHPNVVDVSDVGTEGDTPYLVMEFLEGESLADLLSKRGRLDAAEALDILLPVVSAVVAGHDKGVIHRDLKPQNVFLARGHWGESIPKVLDFGVSKLTGTDNAALTRTLAVLGTAAYMSPEQARGARHVDSQSDQYALGLVLYEMLTGKRAHPGENQLEVLHNIAMGELIPPQQVRPDLAAPLVAVLTRMLALAPTDRFPSLRAAGRALLPFASDRIRIAIPDEFRDPPGLVATGVVEPGGKDTTLPFRSAAPAAGGTKLLPDTPTPPSDTTFSRAASQIGAGDPTQRKGGATRWIAGGLAVAAAGVAVWALTARQGAPAPMTTSSHGAIAVPAPKLDDAPPSRPVEVRAEPVVRPQEPAPAEVTPKPSTATLPRATLPPAPPPRHHRQRKESIPRQSAEAAAAEVTPAAKPAEPATPRYGANKALIIH